MSQNEIDEDIDEEGLMMLTDEYMKELNFKIGTRLKIQTIKKKLEPSTSKTSNELYVPTEDDSHNACQIDVIDLFNKPKSYPRVS